MELLMKELGTTQVLQSFVIIVGLYKQHMHGG